MRQLDKMENSIQILLPVYNEAESIKRVVDEINQEISKTVNLSFIISEDGSTDNTKLILKELKEKYPIILISSRYRKGYAQAVVDGFKKVNKKYVLCLDSDGQVNPKDFNRIWKYRLSYDVVIGWRKHRKDPIQRRILSSGFKYFYKLLFGVKIHDPSCPFLLIKRGVIRKLLPHLGLLREGFWWEFVARVNLAGFSICEVPVHHRPRLDGDTRVYTLNKLPGIAYRHILGIIDMFWKLRVLKLIKPDEI